MTKIRKNFDLTNNSRIFMVYGKKIIYYKLGPLLKDQKTQIEVGKRV